MQCMIPYICRLSTSEVEFSERLSVIKLKVHTNLVRSYQHTPWLVNMLAQVPGNHSFHPSYHRPPPTIELFLLCKRRNFCKSLKVISYFMCMSQQQALMSPESGSMLTSSAQHPTCTTKSITKYFPLLKIIPENRLAALQECTVTKFIQK